MVITEEVVITPEMAKRAIDSAHENCTTTCIHAQALSDVMDAMFDRINSVTKAFGFDPLAILYEGIHIGYRLHQLSTEPPAKETVN